MKPKIVFIGSPIMDLIVRTDHIPLKVETVLGGNSIQSRGGKGTYQTTAAARQRIAAKLAKLRKGDYK